MEILQERTEKVVVSGDDTESNHQTSATTESGEQDVDVEWESHPQNPHNWSKKRHFIQVAMMSAAAFTA
jgi:ribosomal protein L31